MITARRIVASPAFPELSAGRRRARERERRTALTMLALVGLLAGLATLVVTAVVALVDWCGTLVLHDLPWRPLSPDALATICDALLR